MKGKEPNYVSFFSTSCLEAWSVPEVSDRCTFMCMSKKTATRIISLCKHLVIRLKDVPTILAEGSHDLPEHTVKLYILDSHVLGREFPPYAPRILNV